MSHPSLFAEESNSIRSTPSVSTLVTAILLLGFIPGVGVGFFNASSLALGLFAYCVILFFYLVRFLPSLQFIPRSICVSILVLMLYSVIQLIYLKAGSVKSVSSFPVLLFIATSACLSAIAFNKMGDDGLSQAILVVFKTLTLVAILNTIFAINFFNYTHYPPMVPFTEVSQFGHYFGPIAIMTVFIQKNLAKRFLVGGVVLGVALVLPSLTLLVYAVLIFILTIKFRLTSLLFSALLISLIIYMALTTPYFLDRLIISNSTDNLSVLVYLQGFYDVYYSLEATNYLGLGFQLLGTQPPSEISDTIETIAGGQLNREDGGFLAAKILAEFGILGIIFIVYYIKIGLEAFLFLKKQIYVLNHCRDQKPQLVAAIILAFSVELFVRGVGYFSPGVFLFIFSLYYYKKYMKSSFFRAAHLTLQK
jgi:hypothetical protein